MVSALLARRPRLRRAPAWLGLAWLFAVLACPSAAFGAVIADPHILVLEDESAERPAFVTFMQGFRQEIAPFGSAVVYTENLDLARFPDPQHLERQSAWLKSKYRDIRIDILVTGGPRSLAYALQERAALFPGASILFVNDGVPVAAGGDVSGIFIGLETRQALRAALDLMPGTRHVALVADAIDGVPYWRTLREDLEALPQGIELIGLEGLPMAELKQRVATLPPATLIFYVRQIRDREGRHYGPSDILEAVAQSANAPVFGQLTTQMGHGIVGGHLVDPELMGHKIGRIAMRIVRGERAAAIPIDDHPVYPAAFDARQLDRWHIDRDRLPPGSALLYDDRPLWVEYRGLVIGVVAALLLQSALIVALLFEHRRRQRAEVELRQRTQEIAQLNRSAALGEVAAAIAHEVNQPLGSILLNAEAGERLLGADASAIGEAREILRDIRRDGRRAGAVIERVRLLFRQVELEPRAVRLNRVVREVAAMAAADGRLRGVAIALELAPGLPSVAGDPVQLQQVVLNLVVNAAEAMPAGQGSIALRTQPSAADPSGSVELTVTDSGPGVPAGQLERVFDAFHSGKPGGMGIGLSISRGIAAAHGGTLTAENAATGGACFRLSLPAWPA